MRLHRNVLFVSVQSLPLGNEMSMIDTEDALTPDRPPPPLQNDIISMMSVLLILISIHQPPKVAVVLNVRSLMKTLD